MRTVADLEEMLGIIGKVTERNGFIGLSTYVEVKEVERYVVLIAREIDEVWLDLLGSDYKPCMVEHIVRDALSNSKNKRPTLHSIVRWLRHRELEDLKVAKYLKEENSKYELNKEILSILENAVIRHTV